MYSRISEILSLKSLDNVWPSKFLWTRTFAVSQGISSSKKVEEQHIAQWRYKYYGVTCSNQLAVKFCCSQSRSSILHRRHHLFYKIIWLNLKTQTFHQSWSTSWGILWTVTTMKKNHTKDTIQNSKTQIGVIWKAKHTFQFHYTKVFTSFSLNVL